MIPDPERIRVWDARAAAYDRLCRRWEIFSLLSNRLVDLLPADLHGPVIDVGSGTGLTSECLLARHPHSRAILIEPSAAMLSLARRNLAGRPAQFHATGLDGAAVRGVHAVAALASASMQFVDLDPAFRKFAEVIVPGGHVAFNLWWHHWQETAARNCMTDWQVVAKAACVQLGIRPPPSRARPVPDVKNRAELMGASSRHGFRLVAEHCDEYPTPVAFGLDFEAMDADWPEQGWSSEARQALLAKMHELVEGKFDALVATSFVFRQD